LLDGLIPSKPYQRSLTPQLAVTCALLEPKSVRPAIIKNKGVKRPPPKELKGRLRKHMHSINTLLRQNFGYSIRKSMPRPVKSRVWRETRIWHLRAMAWHDRVVYSPSHRTYLVHEQFWGRAVRASCDSLESGALLNFWAHFFCCLSRMMFPSDATLLNVNPILDYQTVLAWGFWFLRKNGNRTLCRVPRYLSSRQNTQFNLVRV